MERFSLFQTPVFVFQLDTVMPFHGDLSACLTADSGSPGVARSNVGGWHSPPSLAQRPEPCFQKLMQEIAARVGVVVGVLTDPGGGALVGGLRWSLHAWAMIMHTGDYTELHDHGDAHWSTVYYVDPGDEAPADHPRSGFLALVDPRRSGRTTPGLAGSSTFLVRPRSGALVVFPGWLQHFVHSYHGQRPRISISANLVLQI